MLFRSSRDSSKRVSSSTAKAPASTCRALVLVDVTTQKEQLVEQIRAMQQKIQAHQQKVERFHQVVVPAYGSWFDQQFQDEKRRTQELAAQSQRLRERVIMAQQILQFAPQLKLPQVDEIIERATRQSLDPLKALHEWEKENIRAHPKLKAETPSAREQRLMHRVNDYAELLGDLLLGRFQQEFEVQGQLHVDSIPQKWVQELMGEFVHHYLQDDGSPLLSLIFFLKEPQQQERVQELVRSFLEKHFPKRNRQGAREERMDSFFEDLEEMFQSLGGGFFGHHERASGSRSAALPKAPSDDCKAVFRRLARGLHPDTGTASCDPAIWMEVQRRYRQGDLQGLLALETDLTLRSGELPVQHLGLSGLVEAKAALEKTLKTQKSEWAKLSRRPEAKLDRSSQAPAQLRALTDKLRREFDSQIESLESEICDLQAVWLRFGLSKRTSRR